jgi:two-component system NarL family sensor kinase
LIENNKIEIANQKLEVQKREIQLISLGIILLLILLITYFIYNRRKLKAKAQLQEEINKQQELAARAVLDAEERERRRIAGDLHDGVGQMLSAALMNLNGLLQKLNLKGDASLQAEQTLSLVNDSYDEMRSISHQMMPNALIKSGLAIAIKDFLNKIDKDVIKISLETVGLKQRLDEQTETVLYRVIQETVNNVIKHSEANQLNIVLIKDDEGVSVTIEDNGKGFDKTKTNLKTGIGISNIYSRVEFLKGTVDIDSAPGKGTLIAIYIPD